MLGAAQRGDLYSNGLRVVDARWFYDSAATAEERAAAKVALAELGVPAAILEGFLRWSTLVEPVRQLLRGRSATRVASETGHEPHTVIRLARKLELTIGLRCGCGRRVTHLRGCGYRRRDNLERGHYTRVKLCRKGHDITQSKDVYEHDGVRFCRKCKAIAEVKRRQRRADNVCI